MHKGNHKSNNHVKDTGNQGIGFTKMASLVGTKGEKCFAVFFNYSARWTKCFGFFNLADCTHF